MSFLQIERAIRSARCGRNALGCRDLFCEQYFEANPGADVMRDVLRDAADI